ncbi:ScbR family autoregulator-binding transcription factor [Arthrobacter bambusae]|uniref:AcrR family transcriptional regulator n=1 Tax=Arthrobacter bambusae TaxID=1338426 RepID=A0AAW8DHG6_9MICC|nr:ScbR family autoregulator-binding transcription factor [Arthrobacter bambusae]MDP9904604.1 AcrR family transcriptional regulator [Arthrobacter bambusae]MDQ0129420.1 AcrR family transcriptional regulator [Arthrobacter bambusae]MDQ0180967.1 AcrR family transcriptional regulator [Arthrobacter bambusae]
MVLQDRARATLEAIIGGAASVFAAQGYSNASLAQVSAAAGVTKGALYFHFKSKEDLARAVIDEQRRIVRTGGEEILARDRPALAKMVLMCRMYGRQLVNEPVVKAGIRLTLEASAFSDPVPQPYEDWIAVMQALAERGKQEGHIGPGVDPDDLAGFIVASFTGVQMVSDVLTGRKDVIQRIEEMWAFLLAGIVHEDFQMGADFLPGLVPAAA